MNCKQCQIELEDFLYGELAESAATEVRQHLASCVVCVAERDRLESENALFAEFYEQTAIDPSVESWDTIRVRIAAEPARQAQDEKQTWRQSIFGWLLVPTVARQIAFALLLIAVSVAATMWWMRRDDGNRVAKLEPTPAITPQVNKSDFPPAPKNELANVEPVKPKQPSLRQNVQTQPQSEQEILARQLARTEREYQSTIKLLERAIAKRREDFSPEAFKKYESSLALIDSSIAQSKRALRELPNDAAAEQFLLAAYAKKVELMQTIVLQ